MNPVEYDCLNSIRYAMKMYLRWEWYLTHDEYNEVYVAMNHLEDVLWEELTANPVQLMWEATVHA